MNAAARGDVPDRIPVVSLLLEHGADINALAEDHPALSEAKLRGRKCTPLHSAAKWGNEEATVWLLEHGADADVRNEMGETVEEWVKRVERGGTDSVLRIRWDIFRKNRRKKEKEKGEEKKKGEAADAEEV
jgi:ankyrin repeat protein